MSSSRELQARRKIVERPQSSAALPRGLFFEVIRGSAEGAVDDGGAGHDLDVFRAESPAAVAAGHLLQADISRDLDALDDLLLPGGGRATSGEPDQDETGAQADQPDRDPAGGPLRAEGAVDKQETEEDEDDGGDIGDDPCGAHGGNLPSCEAV